jgi:hypothetical protein
MDADYMEGEDSEHINSDDDLDGNGCTEDMDEDEEMDGDDGNANVGWWIIETDYAGRSSRQLVM